MLWLVEDENMCTLLPAPLDVQEVFSPRQNVHLSAEAPDHMFKG